MATQICPKCKEDSFTWSIDEEKSPLTYWGCYKCVATDAYSKKSGKEEDETFPRDVAINMGLDYDFGAPPTKGTDWTEEELPALLPRLWMKFHL